MAYTEDNYTACMDALSKMSLGDPTQRAIFYTHHYFQNRLELLSQRVYEALSEMKKNMNTLEIMKRRYEEAEERRIFNLKKIDNKAVRLNKRKRRKTDEKRKVVRNKRKRRKGN